MGVCYSNLKQNNNFCSSDLEFMKFEKTTRLLCGTNTSEIQLAQAIPFGHYPNAKSLQSSAIFHVVVERKANLVHLDWTKKKKRPICKRGPPENRPYSRKDHLPSINFQGGDVGFREGMGSFLACFMSS